MNTTKRAIVCSGGGAKGGYQIGAWQALREIGYQPDIVTGTSVGAMNGALIAMDYYEQALEIWNSMRMDQVFAPLTQPEDTENSDASAFSLRFLRHAVFKGGMDTTPFRDLVYSMSNETLLRSGGVRFGLVTTRYPILKGVELFADEIPEGQLADYIIASASAFPVMKAHKIDDSTYIDGGFSDNMPVALALRGGAEEIVTVDIGAMPSSGTHGETVLLHTVRPNRPLVAQFGGMFAFDSTLAKQNLRQGYLDTKKCFGLLEGCVYTFELGETAAATEMDSACGVLLRRTFSTLPGAGLFERRALRQIQTYLEAYQPQPFAPESHSLFCAETAAELFALDRLQIYRFVPFVEEILDAAAQYSTSPDLQNRILALETQLDKGLSIQFVRTLIESYDRQLLFTFCTRYLRQESMRASERRRLWMIANIRPELLCAALFCAAAQKDVV